MSMKAYRDFITSTDYVPYPDAKKFKNLTTLVNYFQGWFFSGEGRKNIQNGQGIRLSALTTLGGADGKGTARTTSPGVPLPIENPQVMETRTIPWRFIVDHFTISEQETILNGMAGPVEQMLNVLEEKEERTATSITHKIESLLGAVPDYATMESDTAMDPTSVFSYITENDGVALNWGGATVGGFDPLLVDQWDNYRGTYARTDAGAGSGTLLSAALSKMIRRTKMQVLPVGQYANQQRQATMAVNALWCSDTGYELYERGVLENAHDPLITQAYADMTAGPARVKGIDLMVWDRIGEALLYELSSVPANEMGADIEGPRFFGMNKRDLFPILHGQKYYHKIAPKDVANMPFDNIHWRDTWMNVGCEDRRSQGIVSPSVTIAV